MATSHAAAETSTPTRTRRHRKSGEADSPAAEPKRSRGSKSGSGGGAKTGKSKRAPATASPRSRKRKAGAGESAAEPAGTMEPQPSGDATPDSAGMEATPAADPDSSPVSPHGMAPADTEGASPGAGRDEAQEDEPGHTSLAAGARPEHEHGDGTAPAPDSEPAEVGTAEDVHSRAVDIPRAQEAPRRFQAQGRTQRFRLDALATARTKFADHPQRSPLSEPQMDELLELLHEPGKSRSLVGSTWEFLRRGMSSAHAAVCIAKLNGTFVERKVA